MFKTISLFLIAFILFSCNENATGPVNSSKDIDELVRNAGRLASQPDSFSDVEIKKFTENTNESGINYISNSSNMKITNKFDEIIAFNATYADVLYPGAIIQGKDVLEGKLTSIGDFPREPMTLTLQGGTSQKVDNPSLSTVTDGINKILQVTNITPAQMTYNKTELYNSDQAFLSLGLDVNWLAGSLSGKFQKENSVKKKSIFLYFKQIYYTISTNSFSNPSDYFDASVNVDQLKQKVVAGNPPCYISSVSYGRIIIVKMTSEDTFENMKSSLEASYKIVGGKAEFDKSKFDSKYTFEAIIVGGTSKGAADALTSGTIAGINDLIKNEATPSASNPGFPISYTVRYLNGGSPVKLGKTTEYVKQDWQIDESQFQLFDVYLSNFNIIDDGNGLLDGKFFYKISLTDKNGEILVDGIGNPTNLELDRFSYKKVGSGDRVDVLREFKGIKIKKNQGEQFTLSVKLYDYFSNGNDELAGSKDIFYNYPWNIGSDFVTMPLWCPTDDYNTEFVYKIVKK